MTFSHERDQDQRDQDQRGDSAPPETSEAGGEQVSFRSLGVDNDISRTLTASGITGPFPVQEATLPDGLTGRDLCVKAPTGSGKTLAYGIVLSQLVEKAEPKRPRALVLVPTRELARQVANVLIPLAKARRRWVTALYGGSSMSVQTEALRRGSDIVVATPGRLSDLIERRVLSLDSVSLVVVDEADRMADMGFLPAVRELLDQTSHVRQTLLFSATLDGAVDDLIKGYLTEPVAFEIGGNDGDVDSLGGLISHFTVDLLRTTSIACSYELAKDTRRSILFVNHRLATERVADGLAERGLNAVALHGGMTQAARQRSLDQWARGRVPVLVATDVAARGIDVDDVDLVLHLDPPFEDKDYVHRSGRTGRAGASGTVVHLIGPRHHKTIPSMFRRLGIAPRRASVAEVQAELAALREQGDLGRRDRPERPDRPERHDRPERNGRNDRPDRPERRDRNEGPGRPTTDGRSTGKPPWKSESKPGSTWVSKPDWKTGSKPAWKSGPKASSGSTGPSDGRGPRPASRSGPAAGPKRWAR